MLSVCCLLPPAALQCSEAFNLIQSILCTAPLPGGRNCLDDSGLSLLHDDDHDTSMDILDRDKDQSFNGISSLAYKLWDMDYENKERISDQHVTRTTHHIPIQFNIHAANNMYKSWKQSVANLLKTNVPLKNLVSRIPFLKHCLWDIIFVSRELSLHSNDSWSEILAHELIYIQPYIRKEDVHVRLSAAIKRCMDESADINALSFLEISKSIMEENSAIVVESLHVFGGKSGTALPATQTALLCDLLMRTNQLQPFLLDYDLHTELFLNASSSIISSFAAQHHHDIGIRLATIMLLPFAGPDNVRANAQLSEILVRHYPKSDAEAESLLTLCHPLVSKGSLRLLDACESLTLCRAQYYERMGRMTDSTSWLLKGIEIHREALDAIQRSKPVSVIASPNFSKLVCICRRSAETLLHSCIAKDSTRVLNECLRRADEVVHVVPSNDLNDFVASQPAFLLLRGLVSLAKNWILEKYDDAAKDIVYCLDDQLDSNGAVITLAHPLTYGCFLLLAHVILKTGETATTGLASNFDVYGIQILMMRFSQLQSLDSYGYNVDGRPQHKVTFPKDMQQALAKGLMRAFLAENSKIWKQPASPKATRFSGAVTHEEIEQLLEPSLFI